MKNERTSKRVATIAGKVMALKGVANATVQLYTERTGRFSLTDIGIKWRDIRALAASALTQAADKKKKK